MTRLDVRSHRLPGPVDLVALSPRLEALVWLHQGEGYLGCGEALRIEPGAGPGRFERTSAAMLEVLGDADDPARAVAFASFTFDHDDPASIAVVPALVFETHDGSSWTTVAGAPGSSPPLPREARPAPAGLSADRYTEAVAWVRNAIRRGPLDKVVLAREVAARTDRPYEARAIANALAKAYPECYTFSIAGLVGASPELLVQRTGNVVESLVLAGSAPRGAGPAADERMAADLLASRKDRWEHDLAVGSSRASLAPLCSTLDIDDEPWLFRLVNIQHLATRMRGVLSSPLTALQVAGRLHPTAAVCGVPTEKALAMIRDLEGFDRGRYAGPVGWMNGNGDGEWAIALRCVQLDGSTARLFAGCGIVADSDPDAELAEAELKLEAIRTAMGETAG